MARRGATRRRFLRATGGAVVGGGVLSKFSHHARAQSDEIPQSDPVWTFEGPSEGLVNTTIHNGNVYVYSSQFSKLFSINSANGSVEWDFEVEEGIFEIQINNNMLYISSHGNSIHAIEPSSVNELWKYDTSDTPRIPYILDNTVYVGDYAGNAYAINAEDGTEQWTRNFETGGSPVSIDVLDSDLVHLGAAGLQSHFVEPASGNTLWNLSLNGSWAHAKLDGNTVYLSVLQDSIYALTKSNGTQQWRFESASGFPIIDNNTVYVSSRYNNEDTDFFAINTTDGAEKWSFSTDIPTWSSKIKNNTIYLGGRADGTGAVYAVDISSGEQLWEFKPDDQVLGSPEFTNNILYIGSKDSYAYALDATSGKELWHFQTGGEVWTVILNNEELYLGSDDGTLYRFAIPNQDNSGDTRTETEPATTETEPATTEQEAVAQASDQDDGGLLPVVVGALGLGGAGAGALWWRQKSGGDGSGPTGRGSPGSGETEATVSADVSGGVGGGTPTSGGRPTGSSGSGGGGGQNERTVPSASGTDQTADSGLLAEVNDAINTGDEFRDAASDYRDNGQYDHALETYDEAQDAYEEALATASETDLVDTDELEQKLAAVKDDRNAVHRHRLQEEIASLRSDLDRADRLADEGNLEAAHDRLQDLKLDLTSARETGTQHDFDDLHDEIATLEDRREELLTEITERLEAHPFPDKIPRAPAVSVEYEALTDREPIGGGGNADVTKATLPTPDGEVTLAIKEPRMSGTLHTEQVERMLQEAETWDKLDDHDHIVGVVDYGSEPIPWIAMEYMDSGHLGSRSGEMDVPQSLWTAIATTKGVRHAHRRGVAHLDLKPENILFRTVEDAWDVPKVADWGLSKHLLKHSKSVEGLSPQYAAPEQFTDEYGPADDTTDIYQLGAVFYELFTGQPPFEGDPAQAMHQILNESPTPPSEIADVPGALDNILLTALAKEKDDRYDGILLLRNDLQDLFDEW